MTIGLQYTNSPNFHRIYAADLWGISMRDRPYTLEGEEGTGFALKLRDARGTRKKPTERKMLKRAYRAAVGKPKRGENRISFKAWLKKRAKEAA